MQKHIRISVLTAQVRARNASVMTRSGLVRFFQPGPVHQFLDRTQRTRVQSPQNLAFGTANWTTEYPNFLILL
jgi:hypothetical protein